MVAWECASIPILDEQHFLYERRYGTPGPVLTHAIQTDDKKQCAVLA